MDSAPVGLTMERMADVFVDSRRFNHEAVSGCELQRNEMRREAILLEFAKLVFLQIRCLAHQAMLLFH